jgi:hypothetical protein
VDRRAYPSLGTLFVSTSTCFNQKVIAVVAEVLHRSRSGSVQAVWQADRQLSRFGRLWLQQTGQLAHEVAEHGAQDGGNRDEYQWI